MQRKTGAILLVASTCIGGGMIALPMVMAKIGLIPAILLMLLMWIIIYYTALIGLEVNLHADKAMSLGELGRKFSGKIAELIGASSFKILSYALLAVYIYGGSSVLQKMLHLNNEDFIIIASLYALISIGLLASSIKIIDYVNRLLFTGLLAIIAILVIGLVTEIDWHNLPLFTEYSTDISAWIIVIPVVFTAFGFHGSLPTFINYCNNDARILKKVFLYGCFIPALVYIIWTFAVIAVISKHNPELYQQMLLRNVDVGDLVEALSLIVQSKSVQWLIWWISLFAVFTSVLGVGISLCETLKNILPTKLSRFAPVLTILPAYLMAILIPNAFIAILGFAGMILVVIAILLPIYLLKKIKPVELYCSEVAKRPLLISIALIGIAIIFFEIFNMLK